MPSTDTDYRQLKEKVEILTGERGGKNDAAMRRKDFDLIVRRLDATERGLTDTEKALAAVVVPGITIGAIAAPPDAATFNALVDQVKALREAVEEIRRALA
jgi:hypothetical protein